MVRYEIEEETIGRGGFGQVRKGIDKTLERTIAVKTLDPIWAAADDTDKERFRREAKSLAQMSHPNIPSIFDVEFTDTKFNIIFQHIEGKTLRKRLAEGPLSLDEARELFDQIASALTHPHEHGIIHRDVKPENIIVSDDGKHCYLIDFGISLSSDDIERLTGSGVGIGTPGYMSPEQENGEEIDESDDIYSLAMTFYESLRGKRIELLQYEDLSITNEAIPPALDVLVQSCIERKPRRLKSADRFRKQLRATFQRSNAPLSEILKGPLFELIETIRGMRPDEFMQLPAGQRFLILTKFRDLVESDEQNLTAPRMEFLRFLPALGIRLPKEDYVNIFRQALRHGFEICHGDGVWVGDRGIRESLKNAAESLGTDNLEVAVSEIIEWANSMDFKKKESWFFHMLRELLITFLANPQCENSEAKELDDLLNNINDVQRSRASDSRGKDEKVFS